MTTRLEVENFSKLYTLQLSNRPTLKEAIDRVWRKQGVERPKAIWALKDVSFSVKEGEILGIIGPNGSGKSTLLKILARITEPTSGRARLSGRVSSLLEVGTGFHPELSGRENIFLNGTILGMRFFEVKRKLDSIVEFAGVNELIDTPVKRYSSGTYSRLAFSVAIHLEPQILLVDEVLAVGDIGFQKKCLEKSIELAKQGVTILFVSHQFEFVRALCQRALYLKNGQIAHIGQVDSAIRCYQNDTHNDATSNLII